jgi:hypothetical protein
VYNSSSSIHASRKGATDVGNGIMLGDKLDKVRNELKHAGERVGVDLPARLGHFLPASKPDGVEKDETVAFRALRVARIAKNKAIAQKLKKEKEIASLEQQPRPGKSLASLRRWSNKE